MRKQSVSVYIAEEGEYDGSEELVEVVDETVETNFTRVGRKPSENFGRGRPVFQRGRVFRGRGERKNTTTTISEGGGKGFARGGNYRVRGVRRIGHFSYEMEGRNTTSNTSNSVVCHNCNKEGDIVPDSLKIKLDVTTAKN